jgi:hypothetical protein
MPKTGRSVANGVNTEDENQGRQSGNAVSYAWRRHGLE